MLKYFKALGVAGLTTLSASQATLAGPGNVLWSQNKESGEVIVSGVKEAARVISQLNQQHPMVRFTSNETGGYALVPLLACESEERCSPHFDPSPFVAAKGNELWVNFEFVNIDRDDQDLIAFAVKAAKPGRKDRYRVDHDIGNGRFGNKLAMTALVTPPADGDYGYYFLNRGLLDTDEILNRSPGAAIRVTISNHARGPVT